MYLILLHCIAKVVNFIRLYFITTEIKNLKRGLKKDSIQLVVGSYIRKWEVGFHLPIFSACFSAHIPAEQS